ncbi:LpxI family protein [Marimonas lutisalis]|uniref:LpxI family protein n=1 Tax=Marimonas lutisalis TaxID=2545756 RepID=UPI0010F77E42|nr:UDP-2,3-diacylglucosamine diphosphatase LpxI [Marimonas lutisalis]
MLALIAGRGSLPDRVAAALEQPPLVCALEGSPPDHLPVDLCFRLETLGTLLLNLGERGVNEVCFCGAIERPELDPEKLDDETRPLVPLFTEALARGDDGALRVILQLFEQTGFSIRAAHEIAPDIIARAGVPTARHPRDGHRADAALGDRVLAELGAADQGQACVLRKGHVLAREDERGTDAMLAGFALMHDGPNGADLLSTAFDATGGLTEDARNWLGRIAREAHEAPGAGAILFKGPKPGQDRRADLPTIGPATAIRAAEAGFDGIVIEAGGVIVLDEAQVIEILDAMNMFLWVREAA